MRKILGEMLCGKIRERRGKGVSELFSKLIPI